MRLINTINTIKKETKLPYCRAGGQGKWKKRFGRSSDANKNRNHFESVYRPTNEATDRKNHFQYHVCVNLYESVWKWNCEIVGLPQFSFNDMSRKIVTRDSACTQYWWKRGNVCVGNWGFLADTQEGLLAPSSISFKVYAYHFFAIMFYFFSLSFFIFSKISVAQRGCFVGWIVLSFIE